MQKNKEKKVRATPKQLEILLDFIESHRLLISGKTTPNEACNGEIKKLWLEVTDILNASGSGAVKTLDGWKKAWGEWKSHTKKKARDLMHYSKTTGGGPASNKTLSVLENRLMNLISWTTVTGIEDLPQAGISGTVAEIQVIGPQLSLDNVTIIEMADDEVRPTNAGKRMRVDTEEPTPSTSTGSNQELIDNSTYTPRSQQKKNKCEYNLGNFLEHVKESEEQRNVREQSFLKEFIEFKEIMKKQLSVLEEISKALQPK